MLPINKLRAVLIRSRGIIYQHTTCPTMSGDYKSAMIIFCAIAQMTAAIHGLVLVVLSQYRPCVGRPWAWSSWRPGCWPQLWPEAPDLTRPAGQSVECLPGSESAHSVTYKATINSINTDESQLYESFVITRLCVLSCCVDSMKSELVRASASQLRVWYGHSGRRDRQTWTKLDKMAHLDMVADIERDGQYALPGLAWVGHICPYGHSGWHRQTWTVGLTWTCLSWTYLSMRT